MLIVGGDSETRRRLRSGLARHVALVDSADCAARAEQLIARCRFQFLVVDSALADVPALNWVRQLREAGASHCVILTASRADSDAAIAALRCGVADFLSEPVRVDDLVAAIQRHAGGEPSAPNGFALPARPAKGAIIGDSSQMRRVNDLVRRIAPLPGTVLVEGETGTGKELIARRLHALSGRRGRFVPVNCGAIAPDLLESELFGHTRGAFTSAHQGREGLFVAARGGTLYLDEISELPLSLEVKLLRALEESAIRPVGADREVAVDARIVASTQHDLAQLVAERRFREDLYFRLNVVHIVLPPLRERPEDVAALAAHFMRSLSADLGMQPMPLEESTLRRLQEHHWPGNVRELKNVIERTLMLGQLPEESLNGRAHAPQDIAEYPLDWSLDEVKDHHMTRVLEAAGGNKSAAARRLGVSRKTLERRLQVAAVRAARRQ